MEDAQKYNEQNILYFLSPYLTQAYDTLGNAYNFIISYVKVGDFGRFWNSYCNHVKQHKYPFPLIEVTNEINEGFDFAEIRILGTKHNRNGKETMLIHICVKIQA